MMRLVVAGGGRGGRRLLEQFGQQPHYRVTLIETDPETCEYVSEKFPETDIVLGNATDPDTLEHAVGEDAGTFIAITGDDHVNLLASEAARQMGIPTVILRIKDPQYRKLSRLIGLDNVLNPADTISLQILTRLNDVDLSDMIYGVYPEIELSSFSVRDYPQTEGASVDELDGHVDSKEVYPVLVLRAGRYHLPSSINALDAGDRVIAWFRRDKGLLNRYHIGKGQ